jgi:hypothetical protein
METATRRLTYLRAQTQAWEIVILFIWNIIGRKCYPYHFYLTNVTTPFSLVNLSPSNGYLHLHTNTVVLISTPFNFPSQPLLGSVVKKNSSPKIKLNRILKLTQLISRD